MIATEEREKYEGIYHTPGKYPRYGHSNHGAASVKIIQSWNAKSVVDVGCGFNEFVKKTLWDAIPLLRGACTGVDFACPGADIIADATRLPFANRQFDVLTAFDMLEHILPEQVDLVLAEFARVSQRFIFSISHVPSVTKWNGQNLHPTVRGEAWWIRRILHAGGGSIVKKGRYITGQWNDPLKLPPDARVILVGNGPSVLAATRGAEIDAFDEVVRFNTYHLAGFARHTGTRTTLWSTFGRGQLPFDDTERPQRALMIHEKGEPAFPIAQLYRIPHWFYQATRHFAQRSAWWKNGFATDEEPILASSGLLVAAWLLQIVGVKKVTLTGFDHFKKDRSRQHHYWLPGPFGRPKEHDGDCEAAIFAELQNAGLVDYL